MWWIQGIVLPRKKGKEVYVVGTTIHDGHGTTLFMVILVGTNQLTRHDGQFLVFAGVHLYRFWVLQATPA